MNGETPVLEYAQRKNNGLRPLYWSFVVLGLILLTLVALFCRFALNGQPVRNNPMEGPIPVVPLSHAG